MYYMTLHAIFIFFLNVRCQNNSVSEDESEVLVDFSSPDFIPFMAKFRSYRRELSDTDKVAFMSNEMEKLRDNTLIKGLIQRMFDYEYCSISQIEWKYCSTISSYPFSFSHQ